jgi:hypothetical protein
VVIGCTLAWNLAAMNISKPGKWVFYGISLYATCWLAIVTHRMVLMEQPGKPTQFDKAAWKRLFIFVALVAALWVVHVAIKLGIIKLTHELVPNFGRAVPAAPPGVRPVSVKILDAVSTWLPFLLVGRLSLLLPAVATGGRFQPAKVWRDSAGNSWRLAVIVGVLPSLLDFLVDLLYRDGATRFEFGMLLVLSSFCTVLGVVALSLAYRALCSEITAPAPPPTDPLG